MEANLRSHSLVFYILRKYYWCPKNAKDFWCSIKILIDNNIGLYCSPLSLSLKFAIAKTVALNLIASFFVLDCRLVHCFLLMKQGGMTFDHDFCYFILLSSSLLKKEGREKENDVAKIVIKSHTFLFHPSFFYCSPYT